MSGRQFTFRSSIKVSSQDLAASRAGKKTCTIRLGVVSVASRFLDLTDGRERLKIEIVNVDNSKTFGQLSMKEAAGEGFSSVADLETDLRQYYRNLTADKPITILWFKLATS